MEELKLKLTNSYVHCIKFGSGPKNLVIITGISLVGFEGEGAAIARKYECLAQDYTCYYCDRRKEILAPISVEELANDIYTALSSLELKSAILYAFSQGGMIAQAIAKNHPDFVEKLFLASTAARANDMCKMNAVNLLEHIDKSDVHGFNMEFYSQIYSKDYIFSHYRAFNRIAQIGTKEQLKRFEFLMDSIAGFDSTAWLSEIKIPRMVIGSECDESFGLDASKELAKLLGCELKVLEGASHSVNDEDKKYPEKMKAWLDEI